jgi:hypothetical protein
VRVCQKLIPVVISGSTVLACILSFVAEVTINKQAFFSLVGVLHCCRFSNPAAKARILQEVRKTVFTVNLLFSHERIPMGLLSDD